MEALRNPKESESNSVFPPVRKGHEAKSLALTQTICARKSSLDLHFVLPQPTKFDDLEFPAEPLIDPLSGNVLVRVGQHFLLLVFIQFPIRGQTDGIKVEGLGIAHSRQIRPRLDAVRNVLEPSTN